MIIQEEEVKSLLEEFNETVNQSQSIAIFARTVELQRLEIDNLTSFIKKAEEIKHANINKYPEPELNLILCLILSAEAIRFELRMLVYLKEDKMDLAWDNLIQAQNTILIVARNHPVNGDLLKGYITRLDAYEEVLFPRMMFASTGGIIKQSRCSICKLDYEECDHIKGKMYNGELCVREILEIDLEEISMVENPANKLCRQISIKYDGKEVDLLTLKEKTLTSKV